MSRKPRSPGRRPHPIQPAKRQAERKHRGPMLPLDTEAIRKAAFRQIHKQRKALEKETKNLERFLHVEQPAFFSWLAGIAGELLTQGRELEIERERLESLVSEVQERVWFSGITPQKAYREIRAEEEARRAADEPWDSEEPDFADPSAQKEFDAQMKEEFDRFVHENIPPHLRGSFREEVKRFSKEALGEDLSWLTGASASGQNSDDAQATFKRLYRQLVGILHPDRRDPQLDQAICTELWHELQRAYHDRDLERLRTVYARVEYSLGIDTPQQTTVWELRLVEENLRVALRAVKNQIKGARHQPGWQFSDRKDLETYAVQLKQQIRRDIASLKKEVFELRALLKGWETKRAPQPARRKRKETSPQTPELF